MVQPILLSSIFYHLMSKCFTNHALKCVEHFEHKRIACRCNSLCSKIHKRFCLHPKVLTKTRKDFLIARLKIEKKWQLTFLFFVMVGLSGLFELGEYSLDYLFDWKLQGVFLRDIGGLEKYNILLDRIDDTMIDMTLGALGTALYVGFVLIKDRLLVGATRKRL